jgi:multicomponent Na+:H+ antiporter subunit A
MTVLLALHAVLGLVGLTCGDRLRKRTLLLGAVAPAATVVWLLVQLGDVLDGRIVTESVSWLPALGMDLDLRLDGLSALMAVLVAGVGVLVHAYAASYFAATRPGLGRLVSLLTLFAGSMLGLVLADNLLVLYGFWELTSITSFLLIGNSHTDGRARAAALQALLVTSTGALAMLAGFVVVGQAAGTYRLSALLADPPSGTAVEVGLALILAGAFTKSAQYPTHGWLPGAMVAPTPISAYLHSATMVKAGVYLIARLSPAFHDVAWWRPVVVGVGVYTLIAGGMRAARQTDLKLLLAMSTVSQLGLMTAVLGLGSPDAITAGCLLVLAHALAKGAAFMVVGVLDHQHGTRDTRLLPRPGPGWAPTMVVAVVAAASMAGLPLALGFVAKESVLAAFDETAGWAAPIALAGVVVGSAISVGYSVRFALGALGRLSEDPSAFTVEHSDGPPRPWFVAPAALLSVITLTTGLVPGVLDATLDAAAHAAHPGVHGVHLAVWHGINAPLLWSALAIAGGAAMCAARRPLDPLLARLQPTPVSSNIAYRGSLRGLNSIANRVTGAVQSGSLPIYLGVTLLTAVAVPGVLLLTGDGLPALPDVVDAPAHVAIASIVLGAAIAAAGVRRRFTAALFLGVVGYSMAGLFVIQGAPDLALTQVAIESLTTVLFVLVLRRLPDRFESVTPLWRRSIRIGIAGVVGVTVFALSLAAGAEQPATPASDAMVARALPDGEGRNVVNVILVDFRGYDTLGEITVLTAVAIGTVALARAGRRPATVSTGTQPGTPPPALPVSRLLTLDVSMRVVFVIVMVGSLYLLFAGHNQPGGGFVGGLVAGAAIALRYVSGGIEEVRKLARRQPWLVLGAGVLIAAVTALAPLLFGDSLLEGASYTLEPPWMGKVKLTSALAFDFGVYLVVIGLALMMFESFGDDPPLRDKAAAQ